MRRRIALPRAARADWLRKLRAGHGPQHAKPAASIAQYTTASSLHGPHPSPPPPQDGRSRRTPPAGGRRDS
jgi:hypothetical protein